MSSLDKIENSTATFASRWGMIMVMVGAAVGPGNIWRFPRMAAEYGGGTFVVIYILALFLWAIPLLISEGILGKGSRFGVVGAFRAFLGENKTWVGLWMTCTVLLMTSYFNVVGAWTTKYSILAITGKFEPGNGQALWDSFLGNPGEVILFHFIMVCISGFVLYRGVVKGIEAISKWMLPVLVLLILICAIRAITLPGGAKGLDFLFSIQPEYFMKAETWLQAFTQMAWSTGAGWGLFLTYSVYMKNNENIGTNAATAAVGDCSMAIIASMAVIPTVFATVSDPQVIEDAFLSGNQGLTFIIMPELFATMPLGSILGFFFFIAIVFAFLTCQFACMENPVRCLVDMGIPRKKSVLIVSGLVFLIGIPSAMSIRIFNNQDWVWGIGLMLTAVFISWAVLKRGVEFCRSALVNTTRANNIYIGKWYNTVLYFIPVIFVLIFGWWLYQSITWYPGTWWKPFEDATIGTIILQWGIMFIIIFALAGVVNKRTRKTPQILEEDPSLTVMIKAEDLRKKEAKNI